MGLTLPAALRIDTALSAAFIGAGGKTTALFQLAHQLQPPVIVTTSTHLGQWQADLADRHIFFPATNREQLRFALQGVTLLTGSTIDSRLTALQTEEMDWLIQYCGYHSIPLLIEADGAKRKPLKAHAAHEPVIPDGVRYVIQVAGLGALGNPLTEENVHRPELFSRYSGLPLTSAITAEAIANVLTHPTGGLKNIPASAKKICLLNQADSPEVQAQASKITPQLLQQYDAVLIASLKEPKIHAVHEKIAAIILAAGSSSRFGQPKQLFNWKGKSFVRRVAETALAAKLEPVVVVGGEYHAEIEAALKDLPVLVTRNRTWQEGQAASIRAGLKCLTQAHKQVGAAIFLLADQPQVTPAVLTALTEESAATLAPVIAPLVEDRRANPVLFDRKTFPDLRELRGDIGGRGIFHRYPPRYLPWLDAKLLIDIDTPQDLEKLNDS